MCRALFKPDFLIPSSSYPEKQTHFLLLNPNIIPVVGAVISGGLTFATFRPMAKRLQKHLADLALAKPCGVPNTADTGITPA